MSQQEKQTNKQTQSKAKQCTLKERLFLMTATGKGKESAMLKKLMIKMTMASLFLCIDLLLSKLCQTVDYMLTIYLNQ